MGINYVSKQYITRINLCSQELNTMKPNTTTPCRRRLQQSLQFGRSSFNRSMFPKEIKIRGRSTVLAVVTMSRELRYAMLSTAKKVVMLGYSHIIWLEIDVGRPSNYSIVGLVLNL
jgi:hypothetical protein